MNRKVLIGVVVAGMAGFAAEGGEYSTLDLLRLKGQVRREQEAIVRLRSEVDSLSRVQKALASDPRHPGAGGAGGVRHDPAGRDPLPGGAARQRAEAVDPSGGAAHRRLDRLRGGD